MDRTSMSINRWMDKDVVYLYSGLLLSHKEGWNDVIFSNMFATRDYHTKWNQEEEYHITYMWNLKHDTNGRKYKTET